MATVSDDIILENTVSENPENQQNDKRMDDDVELTEIRISQDEKTNTDGMYENKGTDIKIDDDVPTRNNSMDPSPPPNPGAERNGKQEREFYLYTVDEETEIVVAENINKAEFEIAIIPGLDTQVVNKTQLKRLNNNYWKPVTEKKRKEITEFIIILLKLGDIQLIKKAYNQFQILDAIIPSPFSKEKKKLIDHESILHICARYGDGETMKNLLNSKSQNFPLEIRSDKLGKSDTILHAAVNEGNVNTVISILNYSSVENIELVPPQKPGLGRASLGRAILLRPSIGSKEEPEYGRELLNLANGNGETAVQVSILKRHYNLLEILMKEGADLSIQDKYGHNVLHAVAIQNDMTALNMIIQHHKDKGELGESELKTLLMARNVKGAHPAELAYKIEIMEVLLSCINEETERREQLGILLASATERNKIEMATFLVSKGASLDFENKHGMTPLKLASLRGYNELASYMLMEGGDPNQNGGSKSSAAINNAAKSGHLDLIKILLKHNANLWDDSTMEKSALHSAVNGGHSNLIRFLVLKNEMNPNTRDIHGRTPLYYAIEGGYRDCVKELLYCKADPELPVDDAEQKAVHFAANKNDKNILKILLDYGAMSDERNKSGKTPFDIALEKDFPHILKLLLDHRVSLERDNHELDTPMHTIAIFDSHKCADYLLRDAQIELAFEQLNVRNIDKETPIDIAKRKGHASVLITYIERVHREYFADNPTIYHEFFEAGQYDIMKKIFNRMCEENKKGTKIHCTAILLDTNGKGQSPFSKNFSHLLPSLLHKLIKCEDKELREHPIVKKTVEKKLNFYRIWYTITLLLFLAFVSILSTAFYLATLECDFDIRGFEIVMTGSSIRVFLETVVAIYVIVFTGSEMVEFAYGWSKIIKSQRFMRMRNVIQHFTRQEKYQFEGGLLKEQRNYFLQMLEWGRKIGRIIPFIDRLFCYFPRAFIRYLYDSTLDVLGIVSLLLYFVIRLSKPGTAWIFASLAYIAFILSLLKYTRIIPSLGAYIDTVKAVFSKDIPRFLVLYLIVLAAFVGGTHLAARFHATLIPESNLPQSFANNSCSNDTTQLLYFNGEMTEGYTILRPLVTGLILLLDGGPGNREDDILQVNLYFALIYLLFSFTIIVVLSNILIAQLSETYAELSAQGTFYYRMGLIVTMELESSIAFFFGKYFRQLASIRTFKVPIDEWKKLINKTPDQDIGGHLEILEDKIDRNMTSLNEESEKFLTQMEFLENLGDKVDIVHKTVEQVRMYSDPTYSFDNINLEQPKPKEAFEKVKMERRICLLESSMEEITRQSMAMDKKLNQILDILQK